MYLLPDFIKRLLQNRLIRFFIVSGINTIFGYGLFAFLVYIGVAYQLALLFATIAGILFNFKTIGAIVFKNHNNVLIFKFFGVYGIIYLCNLWGLALLEFLEINIYFAGAILLIPIGLLAFILNKTFVFNDSHLITK